MGRITLLTLLCVTSWSVAACSMRPLDDLGKFEPDASVPDDLPVDAATPFGDAAELDGASEPETSGDPSARAPADASARGGTGTETSTGPLTPFDASAPGPRAPAPPNSCPEGMGRLCDDFEQFSLGSRNAPREGWSWLEFAGADEHETGATAQLVPDPTGGRAFRSTLAPPEPAHASARLAVQLPLELRTARFAFDFDPTIQFPLPSSAPVRWCRLEMSAASLYPGIGLTAHPSGTYLSVQNLTATGFETVLDVRISDLIDKRVRVSLDIVFGPHGSVRVGYDGTSVFARTDIPIASLHVTQMFLGLGLSSNPAFPASALYDDVFVGYE